MELTINFSCKKNDKKEQQQQQQQLFFRASLFRSPVFLSFVLVLTEVMEAGSRFLDVLDAIRFLSFFPLIALLSVVFFGNIQSLRSVCRGFGGPANIVLIFFFASNR